MKIFLSTLALLLLAGCGGGLGPIDETVVQAPSVEPSNVDIIWRWEVDSFSYDLIKEQYNIKDQKVELVMKKSGTFEAINFPDFVADGFGKAINGKLLYATGNWKLEQKKNTRVLTMKFNNGELYTWGVETSYNVYIKDSQLVILYFIGDPDQGDRLLFLKK